MCASCECGCKPGKPAKGCDCTCKMCREARASVSKSLAELGWIAKKDHPTLAYTGAGIAGYTGGVQLQRLNPKLMKINGVAGERAGRAFASTPQRYAENGRPLFPSQQFGDAIRAARSTPGYKTAARARTALGVAGATAAGAGLYAYRHRNNSTVEKGLPSALRGTLTPALRSNPAVRERVQANIMGRAGGSYKEMGMEQKAVSRMNSGSTARFNSSGAFPRNGS